MQQLAVFTLSFASLAYEVLLTRVFSISQWHHLAFMVISIALFGSAAAGTALSLLRPAWERRLGAAQPQGCLLVLYSLSATGSFLAVVRIPLDYFRLPLEGVQGLYLLATYLILLLPFFFAGLITALAYAARPQKAGSVYAASMAGSALGALLPAALLPACGEGRLIILSALPPLVLSLVRLRRPLPRAAAAAMALACLLPLLDRGGAWLEIRPSPYKLLPQVLKYPESRVVRSWTTLRGRLDQVESPFLRFAPGLSLSYPRPVESGGVLIQDADGLLVRYAVRDHPPAGGSRIPAAAWDHAPCGDFAPWVDFARYTQPFAGALFLPPGGRALILLQNGGLGVPLALAARAGTVTLVTGNPTVADFFRAAYGPLGVSVSAASWRSFLARPGERYDLIQVENWGPSLPGQASLNPEYLLTVEALAQALSQLNPQGVLLVSRRLTLPPSDILRLFASAYAALSRLGAAEPGACLLALRSWDSYSLLASPRPFGAEQVEELRRFCRQMSFDPVYAPGLGAEEANRYNVDARPYYFEAVGELARALEQGRGKEFFRSYLLEVTAATDDRPFHNRFTRWLRVRELYRSTGSRFYSLLLSGEMVVAAVLAAALLVGAGLLVLPSMVRRAREGLPAPVLLFFLGSGLGFMLVEMGFIQAYGLLLGEPVTALTLVLGSMLIFSGLGGWLSARWGAKALRRGLIAAVAAALWSFLACRFLLKGLLPLPDTARAAVAVALLAPGSLLIGIPFPSGLRLILEQPGSRAYAWAANGVASVVAGVLALPLALLWGNAMLFLAAGCCYALVLLGLGGWERGATRPAIGDEVRPGEGPAPLRS